MLSHDPTLLAAFLDESLESLDGLEARLIGLGGAADLRSEVDAIFRPVHTLKGNAPFFGFMEVQRLAHALETILDLLRKGLLTLAPDIIDALLAGLDGLRACIVRIQAGDPEIVDRDAFTALVARLKAVGERTASGDPWTTVFTGLADIERKGDQFDPDTVAQLARLRHLLDGLRASAGKQAPASNSPAVSNGPAIRLAQRLAKPLDAPLPDEAAAAVMADLRELRTSLDARARGPIDDALSTCEVLVASVGFDDLSRQLVLERLEQVKLSPSALAAPPAEAPAPAPASSSPPSSGGSERRSRPDSESHGKSMRVSEEAVDGFLAYVGDLLVIGDQLEHLQRRLAVTHEIELARDMRQAVAAFSVLSTELQRSIMAVRRLPVRAMLQKAPRLVRDIAQKTGKDIAVEIQGEATEIDKSRLELLDGPLTHLVRNCADHGIEPPAVRSAAGKPARGTISLIAGAADGWFSLEIADDGKGLDLAAIRRKGEALGMIQPGAVVAESSIIDLIFASGLSTASAVTDVSGRGVGMDVVRRQIGDAGGTIAVTTTPGRGTRFVLRLPSAISTRIIPAFLVRDGSGLFALPLEMVRESFVEAEPKIGAGSGMMLRHGGVLPAAPLGRILGQAEPGDASLRRTFVTIARHDRTVAVSVEETLGVHRLVIRQLNGFSTGDLDGRFQGAALLGDGRLALVVDPDRLLDLLGASA